MLSALISAPQLNSAPPFCASNPTTHFFLLGSLQFHPQAINTSWRSHSCPLQRSSSTFYVYDFKIDCSQCLTCLHYHDDECFQQLLLQRVGRSMFSVFELPDQPSPRFPKWSRRSAKEYGYLATLQQQQCLGCPFLAASLSSQCRLIPFL